MSSKERPCTAEAERSEAEERRASLFDGTSILEASDEPEAPCEDTRLVWVEQHEAESREQREPRNGSKHVASRSAA